MDDPKFVAIGEIGLDFFDPAARMIEPVQHKYFQAQLGIARRFNLPVLLHVRRSQDQILKQLRMLELPGGIAHAFNGSDQQAGNFTSLGFKLGFGGAMTFERALQIRRHARQLSMESIVLETDAPDIAPAWLRRQRNSPCELPRIAEQLAELRGMAMSELEECTTRNARAVMPRLAGLLQSSAEVISKTQLQ
jgi:TatD DNase family protein